VRFLRNMLAGVGGVDACLFVVAATEGWKPQSEEHLRILELLGVSHGIVALTKTDLVDDEWRELAVLEVVDHVAGTFLDGAPIVPVAATEGRGMARLRTALDELVAATPASLDRQRPRLWIDRVFAARGSGTVVTGTLTGGALSVDDAVVVEPGGRPARIRSIQSLGRAAESIVPGHRVALNLAGVGHDELRRGDVVVTPDRWTSTDRLDAHLAVLASIDHDVARRGAYVAYVGSREVPVRLRVLGASSVPPGTSAAVRLFLRDTLPLLPGDRFVLRESGRDETVGGGEVLDVAPVRPASKAAPDRSIERVVRERGWVTADELELLTGERVEPTLGRWVAVPEVLTAARDDMRARVAEAGPAGLDVATLDEQHRAVLDTLDDVVVEAGRARAAGVADPYADHPFLGVAREGGFSPPEPLGVPRNDVRELVRRGLLVERDGVLFHPDAVAAAGHVAARLLADRPGGYTIAEFRDALGVTRKHAIPLAAVLDAMAVTRRRGDVRIAGPRLPAA
jgi:selenocysteine-specific elongation factor